MQRINQSVSALPDYDRHKYYMVLVPAAQGGIRGFMPRGRNKGFVVVDADDELPDLVRTLAHELGHGAFLLQHPWEEYRTLTPGQTDNLMDYSAGTALYKYQWDLVHNPPVLGGAGDGDEEGELVGLQYPFLTFGYFIKPAAGWHGANKVYFCGDFPPQLKTEIEAVLRARIANSIQTPVELIFACDVSLSDLPITNGYIAELVGIYKHLATSQPTNTAEYFAFSATGYGHTVTTTLNGGNYNYSGINQPYIDMNSIRDILVADGQNTVIMTIGASSSQPNFIPTPENYTLVLRKTPIEQFYFKVKENNVEHYREYQPSDYIGDRDHGFFPVPVGANMEIKMFRKSPNNTDADTQVLDGIQWEIGTEAPYMGATFNFLASSPSDGSGIAQIKVTLNGASPLNLRIEVAPLTTPPPPIPAEIIGLDFTYSDLNETQRTNRQSKYEEALTAIGSAHPSLMLDLQNTTTTVSLARPSHPDFATSPGEITAGTGTCPITYHTEANIPLTDFYSLEKKIFENEVDESPTAIIVSADVFRRLYREERQDLFLAAKLKVLTPRAEAVQRRIISNDIYPEYALSVLRYASEGDTLGMETLAGTITMSVTPDEAERIVEVSTDECTIFLNESYLVGSAGEWKRKLSHEFGHVRHPIKYKYDKLRWKVIREHSAGRFLLADSLNGNIHNGCGCSKGPGHEKYNSENCTVCSLEDGF